MCAYDRFAGFNLFMKFVWIGWSLLLLCFPKFIIIIIRYNLNWIFCFCSECISCIQLDVEWSEVCVRTKQRKTKIDEHASIARLEIIEKKTNLLKMGYPSGARPRCGIFTAIFLCIIFASGIYAANSKVSVTFFYYLLYYAYFLSHFIMIVFIMLRKLKL